MNHLVFDSLEDAHAARDWLDARLGYPRESESTGGGLHVSNFLVLHYVDALERPTGGAWALPVDDVIAPHVDALRAALPAVPAPAALGEDWTFHPRMDP